MKRFERYIALGDSIISDCYPGRGLGAASLLHQNADHRFPEFSGLDLKSRNGRLDYQNLSRTGNRVGDVLDSLPNLPRGPEETLVLLSVGGNDMLAAHAEGLPLARVLEQLQQSLQQLQKALRSLYPRLTLRVLNVYDPSDGTGSFQSGRRLPEGPQAVAALNRLLAALAGADLVDIHTPFLGHGMRHEDPTYQHHHADDPSGWYKMDIEPNNKGAHQIRRLVWESLNG